MTNANPRYLKHSATFALLVLALSACTNKQLYKVGQSYQKSECERAALSDVQFRDCKNIEAKRFEEYERERQEALQTDEL